MFSLISFIDSYLNRITMYRLVLYYLIALLLFAAGLAAFGSLPFNVGYLIFSTLVILLSCFLSNILFSKVFRAVPNVESVYITGLILALIISPVSPFNAVGVGFLVFASVWAMASKFIFAVGKKHIFNPAAFGVAISALTIGQVATWWVAGNSALLPLVIIGGLLIVRKIRRFDVVSSFMVIALLTIAFTSGTDALSSVTVALRHSAFFFLAFVMLTEPLTMPPDRTKRIIYGAIVGFLFAPNIHIGSFYLTPELALLIGNLFAYITSPKGRFMLTLVKKSKLGQGIYEFQFAPDRPFAFYPGQYLEWTLAHEGPDNRGNRRYFTIASSPTEPDVRLGVKFYKPASTFKNSLANMNVNDILSASHISGDFTLPKNKKQKLVFIAGGIGVTPFRSMMHYLLDAHDTRPVTMLYSCKTESELAYKNIFDRAANELGTKVIYTVNEKETTDPSIREGMIDAQLIEKEIPDYRERTFYISGPHGMVEEFKKTLRQMGVPRWHIKVDYFPGFV
jgi:ferredoxin-NADP reductase